MDSIIVPVLGSHAKQLYPFLVDSSVTATIQWDGPASLASYEEGMKKFETDAAEGRIHMFTILDPATGEPVGSIDIRPDTDRFRADVGLWIGEPFHGRGIGTAAVAAITRYGFDKLGLMKIEAGIFVGNTASRRIFEKSGYRLEGTIRSCVLKRGRPRDEWLLGILRSEFV